MTKPVVAPEGTRAFMRLLEATLNAAPLIGQREDKHYGKIEVLTFSDDTWREISHERGLDLLMLIA